MALPLAMELPLASALPLLSLDATFSAESLRVWLQQWGYGLIFAAMLLENAGLPLPGETITLLGGMPPAAVRCSCRL